MQSGSDCTYDRRPARGLAANPASVGTMDWGDLYEACRPAILAALGRRCLQPADRDECAQEAWMAIVARPPGHVEPARLPAWAARVARNKAIALIRKRAGRPAVACGSPDVADGPRGGAAGLDEVRAVVRRALAELDRLIDLRSCLVFSLRWLEGWSFAEIAGELGMTQGQARLRGHRAKQAFRTRLEADRSLPEVVAGLRRSPDRENPNPA